MDNAQQHILIVSPNEDDYITIRNLISKIKIWSFLPIWEPTYDTALAALKQNIHHLCLVNDNLDELDSLKLLHEAVENGCQTGLILLTQEQELELDTALIEAGNVDYLPKNQLNVQTLQLVIRHMMARLRIIKESSQYRTGYKQLEGYFTRWDTLLVVEQEQRELAEALQDIAIALNGTLNFDDLLDDILANVGRVVPHHAADIMLIEGDRLKIVGSRGYEQFGRSSVLGMSFLFDELPALNKIVETGRPHVIPNTSIDPDWVNVPETDWIRSYTSAPIYRKDELVGFLNLGHSEPDFFTPKHALRLLSFANHVGIAFGNVRLLEAERKQRALAETMQEATSALVSALELQEVLENILTHLEQVIPYHSACLFLLEKDKLRAVAGRGLPSPEKIIGQHFSLENEKFFAQLQHTQQPIYITDARQDPRFLQWGDTSYVRGWMAVPLISWGKVIGYLTLDSQRVGAYGSAEAVQAQTFANQATVAIVNAELFEQTQAALIQAEALYMVTRSLITLERLPDLLQTIVDRTAEALSANRVVIRILDLKAQKILHAVLNSPAINQPRPITFAELWEGLTGWSIRTMKPAISPNGQPDPRESAKVQQRRIDDAAGAIIVAPLRYRDEAFGTITAINQIDAPDFTEQDVELMMAIANQAGIAIQNARFYETIQQHTAELETRVHEQTFELQILFELAQALGQTTNIEKVVPLVNQHILKAVQSGAIAGILLTDLSHTLYIQSQRPLTPSIQTRFLNIVQQTTMRLQHHIATEISVRVDISSTMQETPLLPFEALDSFTELPITVGESVMALFIIATDKPHTISQEQHNLLHTIASQATETIRRLQSIQAAEHQRLESLVAHLPNGVILLDSGQRVILANTRAKQMMPYLTEEVIGEQLSHLGHHPLMDILEADSIDLPFIIEVEDLLTQLFEITPNPITAGSEAGGWILVIRDVTEEKLAQKRIQQQERMAAVGQLAAGIAHDFNNILTSIIGFAELLRVDPNLSATARGDVERVVKQGQRGAHLVRQILDFGRQTISEKRPLDLIRLVTEIIKLLERTIPENIHISLDVEAGQYDIMADLTQLQQALTNLALNARDAMPDGGNLSFRLSRLSLRPDDAAPAPDMPSGDWVVLNVSDTGFGIQPQDLGKIFEPFFTTKEVGQGTGLGLAQTYGIVDQHEGYLQVDSQVNVGTTITLYFPLVSTPPEPTKTSDTIAPIGRQQLVLLVEDNVEVLNTTTAMLQHLGYRVIKAANGHEALEIYEYYWQQIALVLTDMTMPEMGGAELTTALIQKNPAIKVVIMTGYPLGSRTKNPLPEGIVNWLQKPPRLDQLARVVHEALKDTTEIISSEVAQT